MILSLLQGPQLTRLNMVAAVVILRLAIYLALPNRIDDRERMFQSVYLISGLDSFDHRHERHSIQQVQLNYKCMRHSKVVVHGLRPGRALRERDREKTGEKVGPRVAPRTGF